MTYTIGNNWLYKDFTPVKKISGGSKEKYSTGSNICDYIVLHYTASGSADSAHNTYKNPSIPVSWHLTIDTDGKVYQLLDFRKRAWHAGRSNWKRPNGANTGGLNKWAIGIELVNWGPLKLENGQYKSWAGKIIADNEVFKDASDKAWHKYSDLQLIALDKIIPVLVQKYKCVDILGHEEIAPRRKQDPGPALWELQRELKIKYIK